MTSMRMSRRKNIRIARKLVAENSRTSAITKCVLPLIGYEVRDKH
jgi:hypothetical protein